MLASISIAAADAPRPRGGLISVSATPDRRSECVKRCKRDAPCRTVARGAGLKLARSDTRKRCMQQALAGFLPGMAVAAAVPRLTWTRAERCPARDRPCPLRVLTRIASTARRTGVRVVFGAFSKRLVKVERLQTRPDNHLQSKDDFSPRVALLFVRKQVFVRRVVWQGRHPCAD